MNYKIIAFTGKALAGKSTAKDFLKEIIESKYNKYTFVHLSFAQKLKEIAFDLFEWDGDKELYYEMSGSEQDTPIKDMGRQLLINIGKLMRSIRPTVWSDYIARKINDEITSGESKNKIYVIDDLRFLNEVNALQEITSEFILIRVNRKEALKIDDISEKDLDGFDTYDYEVDNNGSKAALKRSLTSIMKEIIKKG